MRKIILQWLLQYADDLLTVAGIGVIVCATFQLNRIAGLYAVGAALVLCGYGVAKATGAPGRG